MPKQWGLPPDMQANLKDAFPLFSDPGSVLRRGEGGILPERGSETQRELVSAMLANAMASAPQSGSPLLAFLAPMLGGAVGSRTDSLYQDAQQERDRSALSGLMAGGTSSVPLDTGGRAERASRPFSPPQNVVPPGMGGSGMSFGANVPQMAGGATGANLSFGGSTNAPAAIKQGLINRGMPEHIADGFLMNMRDESNFRTDINEAAPVVPGSRGGYGLIQWTGPRRQNLEAFAAQRGKPVSDVDTQLDFLMMEMSGPEASAARKIMAAQSAPDAAAAIATHFLRPAQEHLDRRVAQYTGGQGYNTPKLIDAMTNPSVSPQVRSLAETMLQGQMKAMQPPSLSDQLALERARVGLQADQVGLQTDQVRLEQLMQPQMDEPKRYNVGGALVDAAGNVVYESPAGGTSDEGVTRQANVALNAIEERVQSAQALEPSKPRDAIIWEMAQDPTGRRLLEIAGIDPARLSPPPILVPEAQDDGGGWLSSIFSGSPQQPAAPTYDDPLGLR